MSQMGPGGGASTPTPSVGRYALHDEIASGGMATVHLGRLTGAAGFSRTVAIKRLHPQFAKDPEFVSMFLDEARLASRIQHPNAVATIDVIAQDNELFLVMEYVQGESLSKLVRVSAQRGVNIDVGIVNAVLTGALHGLHAAHEARDARGEPLDIVHRDVSPQNILVGTDGVARVLDFGVAKAAARLQTTEEGKMKGKLAYMAPEQLRAQAIDRRADVFAAGIVHWEALTGRRLFSGGDVGVLMAKVLSSDIPTPSSIIPEIPSELDALVMKALERSPNQRYQTAREYAIAIENLGPIALARHVGEWVERVGGEALSERLSKVMHIEKLGDTPDYDSEEQLANARARLRADPQGFASRASGPQLIVGTREPTLPNRPASIPTVALGHGDNTAANVPTVSAVPAAKVTSLRSRRRTLALGALGLLGAGALLWRVSRGHESPSGALPVAESIPSAAPVVAAPSSAAPNSEAAPAMSVSASAAAPNQSGASSSSAAPKARPSAAGAGTTGAGAAGAHPAVRHRDCNPPWMLDARGIRRVKPQCT